MAKYRQEIPNEVFEIYFVWAEYLNISKKHKNSHYKQETKHR